MVTVGTDHHPFDRLIGWTNAWLRQHPEYVPAAFVQSGAASVAPACPGSRFVEADQLSALLDSADVIVCHGGPASIAEAWARGRLPIVVPRLPRLGEHVDDHQVDFCRKVAELGRIRLAQAPADFAGLLDEATRNQRRFRADLPQADIGPVIARFGELVDDLCSSTRPRWPLINRGGRARHRPAKAGGPAGPGGISPDAESAPDGYWHVQDGSASSALASKAHEEQE